LLSRLSENFGSSNFDSGPRLIFGAGCTLKVRSIYCSLIDQLYSSDFSFCSADLTAEGKSIERIIDMGEKGSIILVGSSAFGTSMLLSELDRSLRLEIISDFGSAYLLDVALSDGKRSFQSLIGDSSFYNFSELLNSYNYKAGSAPYIVD
jgi:hypothetical protein